MALALDDEHNKLTAATTIAATHTTPMIAETVASRPLFSDLLGVEAVNARLGVEAVNARARPWALWLATVKL